MVLCVAGVVSHRGAGTPEALKTAIGELKRGQGEALADILSSRAHVQKGLRRKSQPIAITVSPSAQEPCAVSSKLRDPGSVMPARFSIRQACRALWPMRERSRTSREYIRVTMVLPQPVRLTTHSPTTANSRKRIGNRSPEARFRQSQVELLCLENRTGTNYLLRKRDPKLRPCLSRFCLTIL